MTPVDLAVTIDRPLPEAQTQVIDSVDHRLRAVGYTSHAKADTVKYTPKFIGLVFVWLIRRLQGDHVTFAFEQQGRTTEVRATGKLRDRAHAELTEALGGF